MAHSYVEYNNKDFRVHDLDLIVACTLLMNNAVSVDLEKLRPMFEEWMDSISNDAPGCIDLRLDAFLVDNEIIQKLIHTLDLSKKEMKKFPDAYPKNKLNESLKEFKIIFRISIRKFFHLFLGQIKCMYQLLDNFIINQKSI